MKKYIYDYHFYLQVVSLSFLYFISGKISLMFLHGNNIVNIGLFAAEGIALAFILYFGKRVWIGIFIGQLLLALSNDISLFASISIAIINSLEAIFGYYLFNKLKLNIELKVFRDIVYLIAIILFIQLFSAFPSNFVLVLSGAVNDGIYLESSFSWWFGNIMGQLLFTPFLILLFNNYKKINILEYIFYALLFSLFIYTLEMIIFIENILLLLSFSIPIVVFIVSKKGFTCGVMLNVVVALISSYSVFNHIGVFYLSDNITNVINYNLFVLAHIFSVFVTGILFEDKKRYEESLHRTIELEISKNKEQQLLMLHQSRLAQMGEMISMIAHQWRQPLNNLSLVNQLLLSKYDKDKLDENAIQYFKVNSRKQIDLMSKTIDDFRNFFNDEKEKQIFFINDVIKNILDMTKVIYVNSGVSININFEDKYSSFGYPSALSQAILNIINNAKDALIEANVKNKEINIDVYKDKNKIIISIRDNAGGVPENIIDKIFDPYFSTKKEKNGTGLGLYMSKMIIIEKMDGFIDVCNDKNGANFKIYLNKEDSSNVE